MRKVAIFMMMSLDGCFAGPNGELDWHQVDQDFNEFAADQLDAADILLFGRDTYRLMVSYWPDDIAVKKNPVIAGKMNSMDKIVFSSTLEKATWNHTRLIKENAAEEIFKLKQQPGKDLLILGSNNLATGLIETGLIDEFRIMVVPVVLGNGRPLFSGLKEYLKLTLLRTKIFNSGNVLMCYGSKI